MQIQINDTSAEKRALHITVGASLLALLFYLWFTGWFSATVSLPMPVQEDGRLSVNYSWFAQTAGDALAFLGALTIAISSGLAKFGVQVVAFFANRISNKELAKSSNEYTDEMLTKLIDKINETFATKQALEDESAALDMRIEQVCQSMATKMPVVKSIRNKKPSASVKKADESNA
jgi:hypothetical protein